MTKSDEQQILNLLYGITDKLASKKSIADKRDFLTKFLKNNLEFIDLSMETDPDDEDVQNLIADNFLFVSEPMKCFQDEGFTPWLNGVRKNIDWKFYNRYEKYLLYKKHWDWETVSSIKESTDIILDHMANPKDDLYFKKQGLVIGDIQSGKTANYTGLINKAIDVGYKIIIILAGLTRDLRNQTQRRIDKEVLGCETKFNQKGKKIGVGIVDNCNVEGLTYADESKDYGDFKKYFNAHTLDQNDMTPLVAIVKKNKSVLENVAKFLSSSQEYCYTDGKLNAPVLIIDDEVDQASVDTKNADSLKNASAINKGIRTILDKLNRYAYVGYTATPFANVFIDPDKEDDLYPRDFILCLESSKKYCGIKEYFGVDIKDLDDETSDHEDDLFININDYDRMFDEDKLNAKSNVVQLSDTLKDAIKTFIIAASIKKQRGIIGHNSMLIHIARFKNPSTTLKPLVNDYLKELYKKLKYEYDIEILNYKKMWEEQFEQTSKNRLGNEYNDNWDKIASFLLGTIESSIIGVKVVNGDLNEQIDYEETQEGEYIVIGGDKLSRGLTIDGLIVSYYYRKSKMYDSLLQMGRWFGYRDGWIDICRVYTTVRIMNDFINSGKALAKFKEDVNDMYIQKKNPREVGQRIMYSANLIPTSYSKMRSSTKAKISFSEEVQQLISFSSKHVVENFKITETFINNLEEGIVRDNKKIIFKNVPCDNVLSYLKAYKDADEYKGQIAIQNWINYIENVNKSGELKTWTVILSSLKTEDPGTAVKIGKYTVYKPGRKLRDIGDGAKFKTFLIKTNIDPTDFKEIFEPGSPEYLNTTHYDKTKNYPGFDATTGLMSIYIVDLYEKKLKGYKDIGNGKKKEIFERGNLIKEGVSVAAPAIWFPKTNDIDKSAVLFYVNKDYLEYMNQIDYGDDDND